MSTRTLAFNALAFASCDLCAAMDTMYTRLQRFFRERDRPPGRPTAAAGDGGGTAKQQRRHVRSPSLVHMLRDRERSGTRFDRTAFVSTTP